MKLQITGLHMETGDTLRAHCENALKGVKDYFPQMIDVDVNCQKDQHKHTVEIKVHASQIHLRASAEGDSFYTAVDATVEKLKRQLGKYKGRLNKHRNRRDADPVEAARHVEAVYQQLNEHSLENAPEDFSDFEPEVNRKDIKAIQVMSVDEAVMQMDLMHTNCCLFINYQTNALNVVFREEDGNVSWVETDRLKEAEALAG